MTDPSPSLRPVFTLVPLVAVLAMNCLFTAKADTLLSNLGSSDSGNKPSPFQNGNGKAVDFVIRGDQGFVVSEIVLQLKLVPDSRPQLMLLEEASEREPIRVPLNYAAGLETPASGTGTPFVLKENQDREETRNFAFVPEKKAFLKPGYSYRLALSTGTSNDGMLWLSGSVPSDDNSSLKHTGQFYGRDDPNSWNSSSEVVNLYEIRGEKAEVKAEQPVSKPVAPVEEDYVEISGIYPHLAMFNTSAPGECGIGAVVNWADRLWAVTYSPYHQLGSTDKLFQIDPDHHIYVHPESVGGTPANRMIHEESEQLLIGPYLIDKDREVRVIPPATMPGRLTGNARHLTDPENKVYYASMEEAFYEVNVHTLEVTEIHGDTRVRKTRGFAHGNHGKGLYSGQGRVIYANNGGGHGDVRKLNEIPNQVGSLNEWDGETWSEVHRTGFLDVSGPGGIRGNRNPDTDPVWSIGWDYRSVILKVLDGGAWHTYRLPKASHTMDGPHGYNTEWPRIGEIGSDTERLIYVHGMFWRMPNAFSTSRADGLRPRSTYLKMVSDSTKWGDRIVFACNDLSNENQAIRLNPRKIRGNLTPSISHANLWFVEPDQVDDFGKPIGRGSVWMYDDVKAGEASSAYQFGGWNRRLLHLSHDTAEPVAFAVEQDLSGTGEWQPWKTVSVPASGHLAFSLADAPEAEWIRLRPEKDAKNVIATFHYANEDERLTSATTAFDGIAAPGTEAVGGLVRIKSNGGAPLAYASENGYYEMGSDMKLRAVDDPAAADALREIAEIPDAIEGSGELTADAASVIYIDEEGDKRYRLPRGSTAFDEKGLLGRERIDREVCRERNLFNAYGVFYELPYRNAGGFSLIRPITTHNRRIKDYCSWRGLLVMTGIDLTTKDNDRIFRSPDGKAAVWVGVVDDLWKMGKAVGFGGPWKNSKVQKGIPSDPYLMTGFDTKTMTLTHENAQPLNIEIEVDVTGYGDWKPYRTFEVPADETMPHRFPTDFNAYWVRAVSGADATASVQLRYE